MSGIAEEARKKHAAGNEVRQEGKTGLTNSQLLLLGLIASCGEKGCTETKQSFAKSLNVSLRTIDRAIRVLKGQGLVSVIPRFDEDGAQLGNAYRITPASSSGVSSEDKTVNWDCN